MGRWITCSVHIACQEEHGPDGVVHHQARPQPESPNALERVLLEDPPPPPRRERFTGPLDAMRYVLSHAAPYLRSKGWWGVATEPPEPEPPTPLHCHLCGHFEADHRNNHPVRACHFERTRPGDPFAPCDCIGFKPARLSPGDRYVIEEDHPGGRRVFLLRGKVIERIG